ncbi:MAG: RNA 2',3'-cyclic phosphodiesterase [Lachnospiraceae bacterium]|nr:RNA 2',3'-cyclic phosphodiesterase [Lachnospiraceae bacterium]
MRLFIAIKLDDNMVASLSEYLDDMRAAGVRGNFTKPENIHITLAFIGEYGNPQDVLDVMEKVDFCPFKISLDRTGDFGELFWAGIADNPELINYVKRLRKGLADAGIPFDRKKFSPHITLVRKPVYKSWYPDKAPKGSMTVDRISLMKSERGKNGMIYTEIV